MTDFTQNRITINKYRRNEENGKITITLIHSNNYYKQKLLMNTNVRG